MSVGVKKFTTFTKKNWINYPLYRNKSVRCFLIPNRESTT